MWSFSLISEPRSLIHLTAQTKVMEYTDYLVEVANPKAFDQLLNSMGGMLQQNADDSYVKTPDGYYTLRVLGNPVYVEFAIKNQGYGKIIRKL